MNIEEKENLKCLSIKIVQGNYNEADLVYLRNFNGNLYDRGINISLLGNQVEVESLWYDQSSCNVMLHVDCKDFEGDIVFDSMPDLEMAKFVLSLID